ncbi:hypothetical protein DdX_06687 [Ditylenchus destructor]|uniref:C-type lectin domain-containing protein n=1 Tax=Ditylenchus destructor TaxID=166010 RepID=A0AAD4R906_9BILA|nr:hypothetical protein DdX_06687 [Ditylenchus destructor]
MKLLLVTKSNKSWIGMRHYATRLMPRGEKNQFELFFEDETEIFDFHGMNDTEYGHYWGSWPSKDWEPNGSPSDGEIQRCMEIRRDLKNVSSGAMYDDLCTEGKPYICKYILRPQTTTTKITTQSTATTPSASSFPSKEPISPTRPQPTQSSAYIVLPPGYKYDGSRIMSSGQSVQNSYVAAPQDPPEAYVQPQYQNFLNNFAMDLLFDD